MTNKSKYNQAFMISFSIEESVLSGNLEYQQIEEWDSIGHMGLVAELETIFDISLDFNDIVDLSSYNKGMELLSANYGIVF
jgi:acyl carrier protein